MGKALTSSAVIAILIAAGFLSRRLGILRSGDERVLNGYVYYFALPAYFLLGLADTALDADLSRFLVVGVAPIVAFISALWLIRLAFRLRRDPFYLIAVASVFGSLAFFGLPFVELVLGREEPVGLAVALIAAVSPITVGMVLVLLELYGLKGISVGKAVWDVMRKFSHNPLIISLALGIALSLFGFRIPFFARRPLELLGDTAAPMALFSLGVFLYGRRHRGIMAAAGLASIRLVLLPAITLGFAWLLGIRGLEREVAVLMNGTPMAVNMIVLSARYRFFEEEIATTILVSTVGAIITMNLWSLLL